jgi:ubiquinone/menaquinone biosynthesis C-methylase UbiE
VAYLPAHTGGCRWDCINQPIFKKGDAGVQLNRLERLFILSPVRALLQRHWEARQLLAMGGPLTGAHVLETGCGPGFGIDLLYRRFKADRVDAFDLDPKMIALLHRRQRTRGPRARLWVGNVRHIPVADASYDAVVNFGAIHHVVRWREALGEIARVLKPGRPFYCEEILSYYITHPLLGRLMDHPQEDRFDAHQFISALQQEGFRVRRFRQLADLYLWVVAVKDTHCRAAHQ